MTRRKPGRDWQAIRLPAMRDRQVAAAWQKVHEGDGLMAEVWRRSRPVPDTIRADAELWPQMAEQLRREARALHHAELYWVTKKMVDVALTAAPTLPEWTPLLALPSPSGILCWDKPAGITLAHESRTPLTFDAAYWDSHAGRLTIHMLTRDDPDGVPWIGTRDVIIDTTQPRREECDRLPDAIPELSVLAAAWLLMGQPRVAESRPLRITDSAGAGRAGREPSLVSVVDVRPRIAHPADEPGHAHRGFDHQWWVAGHWRQQACGPGYSDRRPIWIAPHIKGPEGTPIAEKVHIWRG